MVDMHCIGIIIVSGLGVTSSGGGWRASVIWSTTIMTINCIMPALFYRNIFKVVLIYETPLYEGSDFWWFSGRWWWRTGSGWWNVLNLSRAFVIKCTLRMFLCSHGMEFWALNNITLERNNERGESFVLLSYSSVIYIFVISLSQLKMQLRLRMDFPWKESGSTFKENVEKGFSLFWILFDIVRINTIFFAFVFLK